MVSKISTTIQYLYLRELLKIKEKDIHDLLSSNNIFHMQHFDEIITVYHNLFDISIVQIET